MGCRAGLEPATIGSTIRGSNQLNYRHKDGRGRGDRTLKLDLERVVALSYFAYAPKTVLPSGYRTQNMSFGISGITARGYCHMMPTLAIRHHAELAPPTRSPASS